MNLTTKQAAEKAGVCVAWFRLRAKKRGVEPTDTSSQGHRGRPTGIWTLTQVKQVMA